MKQTPSPALAAVAALLPALPPELRTRIERAIAEPDQQATAIPDRVLSSVEVAKVFGITRKTVFRLAKRGDIRTVRLPGRKRGVGFLASTVGACLSRCAAGGTQ